jgi:hypothetical protein
METIVEQTKVMNSSKLSSQEQSFIDKNWRMWNISTECLVWLTMQDLHVKLNPGLPWQEQHSTGRRLFSSPNWT